MTHPHVDPQTIPLTKENHDGKSEKDFVKLKLCREPTSTTSPMSPTPPTPPTSPTSDLYELKISLFDNGKQKDFFCLFVTST